MPFYYKQGNIPPKRHTVFKNPKGGIYYEELVSREGFSHNYSNLYHLRMPTRVKALGEFQPIQMEKVGKKHRARHLCTANVKSAGDAVSARRLLFFNNDLHIHKAHIDAPMAFFYRNGHHDELYYIQSGKGVLKTNLGDLPFKKGDYIVIPRGIIYQLEASDKVSALIIESRGPIETPSKNRSRLGQLLEHSPYCERDTRRPQLKDPVDEEGEFKLCVRLQGGIQSYVYAHHPFDVAGYDGYYFPWIFSINDFEPIVGSIHQPPLVHQTFQAHGFVICSFVSRLFDFHPDAIPTPYPHSNVDSDEIIFYSMGEFMSRKGIEEESISYHPMGLPHGPQPGKLEESIGQKATDELGIMIDTFAPLNVAAAALEVDDDKYPLSWL